MIGAAEDLRGGEGDARSGRDQVERVGGDRRRGEGGQPLADATAPPARAVTPGGLGGGGPGGGRGEKAAGEQGGVAFSPALESVQIGTYRMYVGTYCTYARLRRQGLGCTPTIHHATSKPGARRSQSWRHASATSRWASSPRSSRSARTRRASTRIDPGRAVRPPRRGRRRGPGRQDARRDHEPVRQPGRLPGRDDGADPERRGTGSRSSSSRRPPTSRPRRRGSTRCSPASRRAGRGTAASRASTTASCGRSG